MLGVLTENNATMVMISRLDCMRPLSIWAKCLLVSFIFFGSLYSVKQTEGDRTSMMAMKCLRCGDETIVAPYSGSLSSENGMRSSLRILVENTWALDPGELSRGSQNTLDDEAAENVNM